MEDVCHKKLSKWTKLENVLTAQSNQFYQIAVNYYFLTIYKDSSNALHCFADMVNPILEIPKKKVIGNIRYQTIKCAKRGTNVNKALHAFCSNGNFVYYSLDGKKVINPVIRCCTDPSGEPFDNITLANYTLKNDTLFYNYSCTNQSKIKRLEYIKCSAKSWEFDHPCVDGCLTAPSMVLENVRPDSVTDCKRTPNGKTCNIDCNKGFTRIGNLTCKNNEWHGSVQCTIPCLSEINIKNLSEKSVEQCYENSYAGKNCSQIQCVANYTYKGLVPWCSKAGSWVVPGECVLNRAEHKNNEISNHGGMKFGAVSILFVFVLYCAIF